jgi:hypothetical protein
MIDPRLMKVRGPVDSVHRAIDLFRTFFGRKINLKF